jgi:hypothetical protein
MSRSLPIQDPSRLGPFELTGRLAETAAGIVYRGVDPHGRQICLAVLNQGAAGDAAARDRFRAAILAEPLYTDPPAGTSAIVGAEPAGHTPWVATLYEPGARGAERFLDPVLLDAPRKAAPRRRSPLFQPHWLGSRDPALSPVRFRRDPRLAPFTGRPQVDAGDRGAIATILAVAALLVLVSLLLLVLFACQPTETTEPAITPVPATPTQTQPTQSPTPTPSSGSPSPSGTRSGTPSPDESGGEGDPAGDA